MGWEVSKKHGVYLCVYCVSVCKTRKSFFFFFQLAGVPTLFAGLLCVGGVWVKVGHQGKEFNKSCRKRSGSAISERRPGKERVKSSFTTTFTPHHSLGLTPGKNLMSRPESRAASET